ncbi:ParB-like nuclease domain-containing protein [Sulfitobacter pseudonitzschiae]|uniref:ParB-like nuclease domain-containing protein n=1 Tax=Pseudosulfitobacter pseudonitzschiae TaxID=1402135 RepID=A0A9Q2RYM2_9RHOB|nr:ParB/RepB/Spo0J family partition protein [Pseudosulfitobacter pseudonitzschiae]MBM2293763.1 ParB-like nuclease domain-containing protein [Pseudosulfitobacter pseudonitzschiae]MBM2298681.1 ParB-like nuclease domain-containing protein [Pseudosulfitobacter pseudonitzschiae]MBM2303595.1 ParB-like nuclease domain-containing protein [Pseudosulfitobacter pseudonitzschiae]MBM2313378.1 ParB-like nuclease domain-containing protein [Pseudosulfitobacter pseudonitzschiae]MBM2318291.1 ParB-like nuclease 
MDQKQDKLETAIEKLPLKQLRHLETNARYMTADQQQRLTSNITRDGVLTSLPLVWLIHDEVGNPISDPATYEIVSGNHRVTSAREAGFTEIDVIVIKNWISASRRVEIQLAHNAVGGQDDLSVLETLYEGLDLGGKEYSGLTDDIFSGLKSLSLTGFNVDGPEYQEINLTFLPEDATQFEELVKRAAKAAKVIHHLARYEDFTAMFEAIVSTKEAMNVQNSAVAIGLVAELAMERLAQLEVEKLAESDNPSPGGDNPQVEKGGEIDLIDTEDKGSGVEQSEQSRAKKPSAGKKKAVKADD